MSIGRLTLAAGPLVTLRHANRQIGSICRGVMQAVKTIIVQETQVLFERRVMKLPVALRVLAIGTSGVQNRIPQLIDCNLIGVSRERLACPSHDWRAGDAPRVDVVVQSTAEDLALRVPCLRSCGRLSGVNALKGGRIRALDKDKAGAVLGEGIQLQALPLGRLLKIAFLDMLVREPRHGIIGPNDRHVTGAGSIGLRDHHARKRRALDRRLNDDLLAGLNVYALADDQARIVFNLGLQGLHALQGLFDCQGSSNHVPLHLSIEQ